ncbi:sensor histidine kinase [Litorisediminicola beolgyonensis]|uniref:histidine kinase n=1 Tax=Litorisediminicola beolgyonensis TaxID=1173614 RepID=A0ABW3ZJ81_9RHOB
MFTRRFLSLKARFGLGAFALGLVALLTATIMVVGMQRVSQRLDAALNAETRIERYAALSTQVSTFIVVAAEAVQTRRPAEVRRDRLASVTERILTTFARLRTDLEAAVEEARSLGIDEQSRRATQSIGIARMEALFRSTTDGFLSDSADPERLQGFLDIFATGFDPLLNGVVIDEKRARDAILAGISDLRRTLILTALGVAAATLCLLALFYWGLVRPQFRRLDLLRDAAQRIGREDFAVALPVTRPDEIGGLFSETNRMASALAERKSAVESEWTRLNEVIAERTAELRAANDRLAKTDEDRRRFFADISHELRTPLTVILMEAQIGQAGAPESRTAFATIETRARRLNRRIDDLLRVARSESGQLALDAQPLDLAQVMEEVIEETAAELDNAGLRLTSEAPAPVPVTGDPNWLRQVVAGLVRNAVRHARSGGRLHIAATVQGSEGRIAVSDNGPGLSDDPSALFERFKQAGEARAQGFGIGLALARWVTEAQGGRIAAESPLPRHAALGEAPGTRISVSLPLRDT